MKKSFLFLFLFLLAFLFPPEATWAVVPTDVHVYSHETRTKAKKDTFQLDRKFLEQQLGRKLKLKERVLFWVAKNKIKNKKQVKTIDGYDSRKTHPLAILAVPASLIPPLGLVLGIIAISRINRNPQKWKGEGCAIFAIVLSAIGLLLAIIILSQGGFNFSYSLGWGG